MEGLVSAGLVRSIGVSNFNKRQLERILASCRIPPAVNQVEVNIHCPNTKLIAFCRSKNIVVEGYSPLGSPGFMPLVFCPCRHSYFITELGYQVNRTLCLM